MTLEEFIDSANHDAEPPEGLNGELKSLWLAKNDRWEDSHNIAQDIDTPMGSWIHALLHTIEGDLGNAGYWFRRAGKPAISPGEIDAEWRRIVESEFADK